MPSGPRSYRGADLAVAGLTCVLACVVLAPAVVDAYQRFMFGILPGRNVGDLPDPTVILSPDAWHAVAIIVALYVVGCWSVFTWALEVCDGGD